MTACAIACGPWNQGSHGSKQRVHRRTASRQPRASLFMERTSLIFDRLVAEADPESVRFWLRGGRGISGKLDQGRLASEPSGRASKTAKLVRGFAAHCLFALCSRIMSSRKPGRRAPRQFLPRLISAASSRRESYNTKSHRVPVAQRSAMETFFVATSATTSASNRNP